MCLLIEKQDAIWMSAIVIDEVKIILMFTLIMKVNLWMKSNKQRKTNHYVNVVKFVIKMYQKWQPEASENCMV